MSPAQCWCQPTGKASDAQLSCCKPVPLEILSWDGNSGMQMQKPRLCAVFSPFHQVLPENIEQSQAPGEACLQLVWNSWAAREAAIKWVVLMRTALTCAQLNIQVPTPASHLTSMFGCTLGSSHMFSHPVYASRPPAQIPLHLWPAFGFSWKCWAVQNGTTLWLGISPLL